MRSRACRRGFTLIEAIVAIAVVLIVAAIAIPAIHSARETSRRAQCKSALKTIGLALHSYESTHKRFPSGGKGTAWRGFTAGRGNTVPGSVQPNGTAFDSHSALALLVSYLSEFPAHTSVASDFPYNANDNSPVGQQVRAQAQLAWGGFRCPTNPVWRDDPAGYGQSDYVPTVFTDIRVTPDPTKAIDVGKPDPATPVDFRSRRDGCLALGGTPIGLITDGTSNTLAFAESVGRQLLIGNPAITSPHPAPLGTRDTCGSADGLQATGYRCPNRWADPDGGIGVSGPPAGVFRLINNNASPIGGTPECPWSTENCGPNDELFGFHTGGVQAVFADGAVRFLSENMDAGVVGKLVARADGEQVDLPSCGAATKGTFRDPREEPQYAPPPGPLAAAPQPTRTENAPAPPRSEVVTSTEDGSGLQQLGRALAP